MEEAMENPETQKEWDRIVEEVPESDPETRIFVRHPETNEAYELQGVHAERVFTDLQGKGFERFDSHDEVMDAVDAGPDAPFTEEDFGFDTDDNEETEPDF